MTTFTLPERWLFGGVDLSTFATVTELSAGPGELPPLRGADVPMASFDGERFNVKLYGARRITLTLGITNTDAAGATTGTPTQAQTNLETLQTVLAVRRVRQNLVQVMPDTTQRTALAECVIFNSTIWQAGREYATIVADFQLSDPWFYAADVVDASRDVSVSPTVFPITHPGTVRGNRVVFDILGPAANPEIVNAANGVSVQCLVTVAATKHLIIDCDAWTALNDGVQAIGSIRHSGAYPFMYFEPGSNSLTWTATGLSAASRLTTTFKPPFI